jgi:hypothetical protein
LMLAGSLSDSSIFNACSCRGATPRGGRRLRLRHPNRRGARPLKSTGAAQCKPNALIFSPTSWSQARCRPLMQFAGRWRGARWASPAAPSRSLFRGCRHRVTVYTMNHMSLWCQPVSAFVPPAAPVRRFRLPRPRDPLPDPEKAPVRADSCQRREAQCPQEVHLPPWPNLPHRNASPFAS